MADERDPLVSRRYRDLGSEEPPAALDQRILARARGRRSFRWHGPVAAAAIIVLAVAVTVHVEREQPQPEPIAQASKEEQPLAARKNEPFAAPAPPAAPEAGGRSRERRESRTRPSTEERKAEARRDAAANQSAPEAPRAAEEAPAQPALRAQQAPAAGAAADSAAKPMASPESRLGKLAGQSPEQWLEAVVELRRQGRHAEADESLKRFRERYPDYRIAEEMKAKIERR